MSKVAQGEPKSCKCGMCIYPAVNGSEYCDSHRGIMESFERKRKLAVASLPESQPVIKDHENWCESIARECNCGADTQHCCDNGDFGDGHTCQKQCPSELSQPAPEMDLEKLANVLCNVAQLLDGWHMDGTAWSEWDESVRRDVSDLLREVESLRTRVQPSSVAGTERLREALERIAHPIDWIRKDAEKFGGKINGRGAIELSNDANYLKQIAESALKESSR